MMNSTTARPGQRKNEIRVMIAALAACLVCLLALAACGQGETPTAPSAELTGTEIICNLKSIYVRNEEIDLSGISVELSYADGTHRTLKPGDEGVSVEGGDTSVTGDGFTIKVSYGDYVKEVTYSVRDTRLTLLFGDGTFDGKTELYLDAADNYTDLAEYQPVPNDSAKEFAGWFYDEALTKPVSENFGTKVNISSDITLYAGYDTDYSDWFEFAEENGEITLTALSPLQLFQTGILVIPDTVRLRPVTKIADGFVSDIIASNVMFEELYFGEHSSVREIGNGAFAQMANLTKVTFPETLVRIGDNAFSSNKIRFLSFPSSLDQIGDNAFTYNSLLMGVEFASPSNLTAIGDGAFSSCTSMTSFSVPDSVSSVGAYAFSSCDMLEEVHIGVNTKNIGLHAFMGCSNLTGILVDKRNLYYRSIDSNLYSKDGATFIRYCFGKTEEEFTLPEGVTSVYESAFDSQNVHVSLRRIHFPESLSYIGDYAFRACTVSFVIPAGVKSIAENAFYNYPVSEFEVAENNPYYTVLDGVLYSKDMTRLIAIPTRYAKDEFVLDNRTGVICTGAFAYNETVKYFVIPADSALKKLESGSLLPFQATALCGIYIYLPTPFTLETNAMVSTAVARNEDFIIFVPSANIDAYRDAWDVPALNSRLDTKDLFGHLYSETEVPSELIAKIRSLVGDFNSYEEYDAALNVYFAGIREMVEERGVNVYLMLNSILKVVDGALRSEADISEVREYLDRFENEMFRFLTDLYAGAADRLFCHQGSFYQFYAHYLTLPDDTRATLADLVPQFEEILKRTDTVITRQAQILKDSTHLCGLLPEMDVEKARQVYADYCDYGLDLVGYRWSDFRNIFRLHCSILIYDFMNTPMTADNLNYLRRISSEYTDEYGNPQLGINKYLNSLCYSASIRATLYRYADYIAAYQQFEELIPALVEDINRELADYDLSQYEYADALRIYWNYTNLSYIEQDFANQEKYSQLLLRLNITEFCAMNVDEDDFALVSRVYYYIITSSPEALEACGVTAEEWAQFEEQAARLQERYEREFADLLSALADIEGFAGTENALERFSGWMTAAEDNLYSDFYELTLTVDGEEMSFGISGILNSVMKCLLIRDLTETVSSVTVENMETVGRLLNGYWSEDFRFVSGIFVYEMNESPVLASYFDPMLLSDETVANYERLQNEYSELSFGEM